MKLIKQSPKRALNKAFLKQRPLRSAINLFKENLLTLLGSIDEIEREENQKNHVRDFLRDTYYKGTHEINTKDTKDLVIHTGKTNKDTVGVIIEAKRPSNKSEMLSFDNPNAKAFQELVLYYLRERIEENNSDIKYLIATNIYEWYIIEASYFENLFNRNKTFVKAYKDWRDKKKVTFDTNLFYNDIAKPFIDSINEEIPCIYFDIRDYEKVLINEDLNDDKLLITLYKILSPYHLLKEKFLDDSNKLDERFYKELLHIIGLEEAKEGSKSIIRRKKTKPDEGSLIENTISILNTESLNKVENQGQYGATKQEKVFNLALELCITWINRILFLKLLEAQLISYHNGDKSFSFLNFKTINDFDELYKLFHQVLANKFEDRSPNLQAKYNNVPYLNSSLFEISPLEEQTIKINSLDNAAVLELINSTILKDIKKKTNKLPFLEYIFNFLNAYDFASEGSEDIQETEEKSLINASVLGKVFEKINGYKDGSIFTPGFITMYMSKQAVRLAVVQKFKDTYKWNIEKFEDIKNYLTDRKNSKDILEFNAVIDSLRICDPAVGSGHFLVSVLNEIIVIKAELGILADVNGYRITEYEFEIENDELIITDSNNNIFTYLVESGKPKSKEIQRLQETLFKEKRIIIENCLFGVDINPNSVKICRLRLWIELLKNAYYKADTNYKELETLPNIDINIKCGNSLISRYNVNSDLKEIFKEKGLLEQYKTAVLAYKNSTDKEAKDNLLDLIKNFRNKVINIFYLNDPLNEKLSKYKGQLALVENKAAVGDLFEKLKEKDIETDVKILKSKITKIEKDIQETKDNKIYQNAFEWRFDFPEVLDENGRFLGFDLVIGNPPYIKEYENRAAFNGLHGKLCYQGKMDIWYLFGQLGIELIKNEANLSIIATNNWVTNYGASKFRNYIVNYTQILSLIDFGPYMVFENASIQTMVMLFRRNGVIDNYKFDYRKLVGESTTFSDAIRLLNHEENNIALYLNPQFNKVEFIDNQLIFNTSKNDVLLKKIKKKHNFILREKANKKLKLKSELGQGIVSPQDSLNKKSANALGNIYEVGTGVFVLTREELDQLKLNKTEYKLIKPYFTTEQIGKYCSSKDNYYWIIYTQSHIGKPDKKTKKIPIDDYPRIKQHLLKFEKIITSDNKPFGLHRSREQHFFENAKILSIRKCPNEPVFSFVDFDCYVSQTFNIIQSDRINLKYLTGLLNSKLIAFWLLKKGKMQGNNYQIDSEPILEIPILKPTETEMDKIALLVDTIIDLKSKGKDSISMEKKIDELVYELYDINKEEQKIIEESFNA